MSLVAEHASDAGGSDGPSGVLVIGAGLLGGSVGLALTRAGRSVWLRDRNPQSVADAVALGAGSPWPEMPSQEGLPAISCVVVAVPPSQVGPVMVDALAEFEDAVVTDVSSVKARPIAEARARGADLTRLVGGHPLAGREKSGARAATADLFHDRPWVVAALPETSPEAVSVVRSIAEQAGAVVVEMTPEDHDRAVALTSHLPQIVASAVAAQLEAHGERDVSVSGQGLRDVTRIAESDPGLWTEILLANSAEVAGVLGPLVDDLSAALELLGESDRGGDADPEHSQAGLTELLAKGNRGRARVPAKHGGAAADYEAVQVLVADEPGQLGALFAAAGDAGINLEDVRIDHSLGRLTAIVDLLVRPESAPALRESLAAAGWQLSN